MNRTDLIDEVTVRTGMPRSAAANAVNAVIGSITDALGREETVMLPGFGTFSVKERSERTGHNPGTGEKIIIPAGKSPSFKAGKKLKENVSSNG